jgi:uncharacterized protein
MKIWVDICTPPQVLFMRPIVDELHRRGHETFTTTRQFNETVALADQKRLNHSVIGAHGGKTAAGKAAAILTRTAQLMSLARRKGIQLAISHSSYSQALAATVMRIPFIAMTDYEGHPGMRIVCQVARRILVPDVFDPDALHRLGAARGKVQHYCCLKEDIYLSDFEPDPNFKKALGIPANRILVTMRPASEVASYHQFENPLFEEAMKTINCHDNVIIAVLPRTKEQRARYTALRLPNVMIPDGVLDGPNLVYHSDLVVGAGGTMNREAVALGTPVYTMFKGMLGSIDRYLIKHERMHQITETAQLSKIVVAKKPDSNRTCIQNRQALVRQLVDQILAA